MGKFNDFQSYLAAFFYFFGVLTGFLLVGFILPTGIRADVPEARQPEVKHLIEFLSNSGCRMDRNGKIHDAQEAADHIRRKYDYFRDEIKSTEDFIDRSASRSSLSGRSYQVLCPEKEPRPTADWLKEELERFRKQKAALESAGTYN